MSPTIEALADAVYRLGTEEPVDDIRFDVWKQLTELKMIERGPKGEPQLTTHGEKTFTAIESGDRVPEFDAEPI